MKTNRPPFAIVGLMSIVLLVGALAAWAQQSNQQNQNDQANQNQASQTDQNQANQVDRSSQRGRSANAQRNNASNEKDLSKLDDRTRGATIRASQLEGMNIQNSNGDSVGEINDLVIDSSGKVRYVAVTYGGVLGVGSKMFAVPFEAFKVRQNPDDPNDADDYVLTLDVNKEQLDGQQGFDNDHWPDFADTKFTQDLARRYKVGQNQNNNRSNQNR